MNRMREMREKGGRSQPEIARALLLNQSDISRYETDKSRPTPFQFRVMCELFGCQPNDLLDWEDVDYGIKRPCMAARDKDTYKMTNRIPIKLIGSQDQLKAVVKAMGYRSLDDWITKSIKRLYYRYKKKAASGAANTESGKPGQKASKHHPQYEGKKEICQDG